MDPVALLAKIPSLLLVTYCLQISLTAPTPRTSVKDGAVITVRRSGREFYGSVRHPYVIGEYV
jgi:hypothetical protein